MNFVRTSKSVQALLRTASLTVLGAGVLLVPAHAGLLYNENFNQVTLNTAASAAPFNDQVGNTWSLLGNAGGGALTANGGPNFNLTNTGWSEASNQTGSATGTGDVFVDLYSGGSFTPPSPNTNGNAASSACTTVNCGLLLNTSLGGAITNAGITGLGTGLDALTIWFWSDDNQNTATRNTLNFNVIINGTTTSVSQVYPGGTTGAFSTTIFFTPVAGANTVTIRDTNADAQTPALVVGDVQISNAPEPASAFFLLVPAAGLLIRRRMTKK